MSTPAIQARGLHVQFGQRVILNNLNVDIDCGQVIGLLGPNGAGKSTLLKLLSGEIASEAEIRVFGQRRQQWEKSELARHVGLLPQSSSLSFAFTAQEVVELGAIPLSVSRQQVTELARHYMHVTDVAHLAHRLYPSLSGGEKQRLHLARVLTQLHQAGSQKILMLDEPTSALDLAHQHNTLQIVRQLATEEQCAVIVVLHDLNLAAQYADRMLLLSEGELVCDAAPWQALTTQTIQQVYGFRAVIAAHPTLAFPVVYPAK
ncbi:heme ABC transporter ATP-binding protein [Vibrio ostreae]|uniref:Heme ABC transporter ATP-binding protein n=1 Tax=Vibrio ostreae TaxID=2841925 RepID=A0A975U7H4_9VIBR|nr:heme ABC transporter ATP-binding protein [Vibrio ostreae]QXO16538.1 heme ABC transporter ATP-binding protein [Vibrio ostreae]